MKALKIVSSLLVTAAVAGGCVTTDADTLDGALGALSITPATTATDVFTVEVHAMVDVAYTSADPVVLEITDDGATVVSTSLDVTSAMMVEAHLTVPLHPGPNKLVAIAHYRGDALTQEAVIDAAMTAPTITLPSWTTTYTVHEGKVATGTITVAANAAYAVDAVEVAVDGGPWQPAPSDGNGGWAATITDPDIGDSDVAVRVTTSVDGQRQQTTAHGVLTIAPVFDCAGPGAMLPSTDFIQNNGTEQRVMAGYFGRPDGGHSVDFVLGFTDEQNIRYAVVGSTLRYGTNQIETSFNVSRGRCNTNNTTSCTMNYDLTVLVDGVQLCTRTGYGKITRYN